MARHRSHSIAFKRQVAQEFIAGATLHALAKRHDISRTLIRFWVEKRSSKLGRLAKMPRRLIFFRTTRRRSQHSNAWPANRHSRSSFKGGAEKRTAAEKRDYIRHRRPDGISIAEGCRLMGRPRST
jgi:transposase-like protein